MTRELLRDENWLDKNAAYDKSRTYECWIDQESPRGSEYIEGRKIRIEYDEKSKASKFFFFSSDMELDIGKSRNVEFNRPGLVYDLAFIDSVNTKYHNEKTYINSYVIRVMAFNERGRAFVQGSIKSDFSVYKEGFLGFGRGCVLVSLILLFASVLVLI